MAWRTARRTRRKILISTQAANAEERDGAQDHEARAVRREGDRGRDGGDVTRPQQRREEEGRAYDYVDNV